MSTPSLKEFVQAIPVCEATSSLAAVLEIFRGSGCNAIVVVSEQQRPLGAIELRQVLPYLISPTRLGQTPVGMTIEDFQKPLFQLEPPIVEPLQILSAQLNLSQFWAYLQESGDGQMGHPEQKLTTKQVNLFSTGHAQTVATLAARATPRYANTTQHSARAMPRYANSTQHFQDREREEVSSKIPQSPVTFSQSPRLAPLYPGRHSTSGNSSSQHWALVDEEGKFLGLLNSWQLLNSVASEFAATDTADTQQETPPDPLAPLVQLLEQLPLPLSLQTTSGKVLAQNLSWRQQIGTTSDSDWLNPTTASRLDSPAIESSFALNSSTMSEDTETLTSSGLGFTGNEAELRSTTFPVPNIVPDGTSGKRSPLIVGDGAESRYESSAQATTQRYCALDTPYMAAAVSKRRVMLSALPMIQTHDDEISQEVSIPALETRHNYQERSFSFLRVPLSPSFVLQEEKAEGARLSKTSFSQTPGYRNGIASPASPTPALPDDLLLVLAQDTTEQQQVAKELAAKNADLVQLNRLKDEFLACISHELKTPLTAVLGLSSLLKDQALGTLNERQARYARLIYHSGRQLMTVVNDILDLTRMETGQLELTLEPVQIQSVCDRAYCQAQQRPSEKDHQEEESTPEIKFTLEIEPGLELLVADELRLRQMLMHLLSNAIKFTDTEGEMGLRVNRWEGWIAFTVWDTGLGIPPEQQHLIFQKFQQLEKPLTRRHEGTGLGLVLTQRLARLHGGDVSFISKAGEGSQFTLLLPPTPPQWSRDMAEQAGMEAGEISQAPIRNRLVLIVETVPRYLEDLTEQLKNLAYRVVIARSGTEAIEKARRLQPCAILLNPLLPQLSGWDVLTLLKSDAQTSHIPVIVTATQAEKQQAYHNKADDLLSLPVQEQDLLESLTSLSDRQGFTQTSVTILHLSPELDDTPPDSSVLSSELTEGLNLQNSGLNYRVLEADDLDQAELLARVWHPDVILLDSSRLADPLAYLKQFSSYTDLTALPLVTLDHQTTEAANYVTGLSVYPCLSSDNASRIAALLQVIQVAAGMSHKPNILVMDIGEQAQSLCQDRKDSSSQTPKSQILNFSTTHSSWLQALIQYLETAGFRSILSCSWAEIHRHLQDRSVDLVLLRLRDASNPSVLAKGLISLTQLEMQPPILVLDHRLEAAALDEATAGREESTAELDSLLRTVATQILPGHSQSMSQLLHQINQTLMQR